MPSAKPIFIEVRPFQVSHLCFEVGGILGESFVELGADVSAFNFDFLYKAFRAATSEGVEKLGRLAFDSKAIDFNTKFSGVIKNVPLTRHALAALRAEPLRAALDKAISARANAVMTKYANTVPIISELKETARIKGELLPRLISGSDLQTKLLFAEYENDGLTGPGTVVKNVTTRTTSTVLNVLTSGTKSTTGQETATTSQIEYRVPSLECLARNERAQIMLRDEQFGNFLQTQNLERLGEIFKNELASIDADVNQLQIAYLNTILLSPIKGTVTGVYKNPGDKVSPGEPVFRVENDTVVLIVANVVFRGAALISSFLQVETTLFDPNGSGSRVLINATIVAARGQGDDDRWEVIGKVSNIDAAGKRIFPLGYHFDNDITAVSIGEGIEI
jgi:hypothetical protein